MRISYADKLMMLWGGRFACNQERLKAFQGVVVDLQLLDVLDVDVLGLEVLV
jgi:hypothetical protein